MSHAMSGFKMLTIGLFASSLWACGQAGPLYLPQDAQDQTNQQTEQESASDSTSVSQNSAPDEAVPNDAQPQGDELQPKA